MSELKASWRLPAKAEEETGEADATATATVAVRGVPMGRMPMRGMTGAAAMAHGAVAILRAAMTITTDNDTLTIDRCAAGTAGVREAAATRMTVTIACLAGSRSEDGKADRDGQEGDEFFHEGVVWF